MPEWYKWRQLLQRPGQETSTVSDKPNEYSYQLHVPEFKIPTVTNPEYSVEKGLVTRKAKDAYDAAYKEYLEQHPVSTGSRVTYAASSGPAFPGDVSFSTLSQDPVNTTNEEAHKYAVEKSGYNPGNPNDFWRTADELRDKVALGASVTTTTLPLLLTASAGTLGAVPKLGADLKFAYDGYKSLTGPEGWAKTNNFWKEGRYGRAAWSGLGDLFDASLFTHGVGTTGRFLGNYGRYAREALDATKFNFMNRGTGFRMDYPWQIRGNAIPNGTIISESGVPMLQARPLQLTSTTARTQFSPINFSLSESYRIPRNKPMVIGPDYKQMFMDWYRQNIKEPNITVDHIKQFVAGLPTKDNELFKRNFNEYIDELTKGNTYHSALGTGDIVNEFQLMSMPERDPEYLDKQDILDFYRTDALPRVLKNIRDAGIDLTSEQIQEITNIYSNPFEGVNSKIRYMPPGVGGFSRSSDEIGYSNRYFDRDVDGNPTSFIDSQTVIHELHHRLRSKLGEYLRSQGIILNLDPPSDPNNPFKRASWTPPLNLSNQSSDLVEHSIRNRSPQTQYTPEEIRLMEPLGMTLKYRKDKTPIAEIGAVSAGNARFKFWQKAKSQVPEGILPTIEQTNSFVNNLPDIDLIDMYRELPYGSQIGSASMQEADNLRSRLLRRDELYGILTNSRYEKLPFYKKWFVKPITRQFGLFNDRYLPTTDDDIVKIGDEWRSNFAKAIREAITGIAAVGPVALGAQISKEKQGGIIKRK